MNQIKTIYTKRKGRLPIKKVKEILDAWSKDEWVKIERSLHPHYHK